MKKIVSTNPAVGYQHIGEVVASTKAEIVAATVSAKEASLEWGYLEQHERTEFLEKVHSVFESHADEIQEIVSNEVGKTRADSKFRFESGMKKFRWCLDNVEQALAPVQTIKDETSVHHMHYEPLGVAAVISPWNHPFQMALWGLIPNLLVGNTVVFKISEECPLTGVLIEKMMKEAKLPEGVFNEIYGDGEEGAFLADQDVDLLWFTGSSKVGCEIFEKAGKKFIKSILELGGSNAMIVFDDVDVAQYLDKIFFKRFGNCGQSCDALKRLLVHESIFDSTVEQLKTFISSKKFGLGTDEDTVVGSLAAARQVDLLESQVNDATSKGAKAVCGGKRSNEFDGAYFEPTLLTGLNDSMRLWDEEAFGPSLSVIPFSTEQEAIEIANCTEYGLGAVVLSKDLERAERVAKRMKAGTVEINSASHWHSENPFGGYKKSGMGREHGVLGLRELCQVKVISREI